MYSSSEIHLTYMNPKLNKAFRAYIVEKYGRLYGFIGKETEKALIFYNEVESGRVEIIDESISNVCDTFLVSRAELENYEKNYIPRKNEKTQYYRFSAKKLNQNVLKEFRNNVWDKNGSTYSYMAYEVSIALELYLKSKKGQIKIMKKSRQTNEKILKDNKSLKNMIQMVFNQILGKTEAKKERTHYNKAEKAEKILDGLKKENKKYFTLQEYEKELISIFGYGDQRTRDSYLNLLKLENKIVLECGSGFNGSKRYCFTENSLYKKYNGPKAMRKFIQKFKSTFKDHLQTSKTELESFISRATGLKSVKNIEERLETLSLAGYIHASNYSPKIFNIHLA